MSFNNFPNPNATPLIPSSYQRGDKVREYVDYYTDAQKIRMDQALEVQGVEAIIWNKHLSKRFCTCQGLQSSFHNNSSITTNVYTASEEEEEEVRDLGNKAMGGGNRLPRTTKASQVALQNGLGNLSDLISNLYEKETAEEAPTPEPKTKVVTKQQNQIEEALLAQRKHLGVENNEYINCPICFNTRHVDTYQPYKGQRLIFDAGDFYKKTFEGVLVDKTSFPWTFEFVSPSGFLEWEVELPKYLKVESIRPFFLNAIQTKCKMEFREVESATLLPLSVSSLSQRDGLKNKLVLRISPREAGAADQPTFKITHLEVILRFVDRFDLVDIPTVEIPESLEYIEVFLRSRFALSPHIEQVMRGSIILEKKMNLAWEVLDVSKIYTASGKIVNQEVDVRLIQNSEKLYMLNYLPPKFSMWRTSFMSTT